MAIVIQSTYGQTTRGVKCLVYGPPKVGKTRLIATAPGPFLISAEGGTLSLRTHNIPYVEVRDMPHFAEIYRWVSQSNEARQFATFSIDSLSEIVEKLLEAEKVKTRDPRKAYGEIVTQGLDIVRKFRDIDGPNVLLIAKQEYAKDEGTGFMQYGPSFPGQKLGQAVPYFPDEIFQYCVFQNPQTQQRVEALRCWANQQNVAGDRSGALDEFEPPNLSQIFAKINSGHVARR
jgi:hypothetical protein